MRINFILHGVGYTGDDIVAFKHGEKSAHTLSSAGFRNLTFKTYNGYVGISTF